MSLSGVIKGVEESGLLLEGLLIKNETLIDIPISTGKYCDFINEIISKATNSVSSFVCVMNVHMFVEAYFSRTFKLVIENADIVTPDGKPITWALRLIKDIQQSRVAGMDLLPSLLEKLEQNHLSTFFYGGTNELLNTTQKYLTNNFPTLDIAGFYSPPFRMLEVWEEREVIEKINASGANIVFVVLGCPKQEKWMASMKGKIKAVMIGIGGALPVMIGMHKRAPGWMQENGLEWFYRFYLEPKRLFKRYAVTNSVFVYLICKEIVKKQLSYPDSVLSS
ncbi:MAG TPA: WecB/TagA/CpsF family glycosyltransferase [Segetibacter sp.]